MTVRRRGAGYQADFMIAGTRYRETFDKLHDAEDWEDSVRRAIKRGLPIPKAHTGRVSGGKITTLGQLFEHVKRGHWSRLRSGVTLARSAEQAVDVVGRETPVVDVTKADLDEVVTHFLDSGLSVATVNRKLAGISKLLTEAVDLGLITKKPKIPLGKEGTGRMRFLTQDEEDRMLGLAAKLGMVDLGDFLAYALDTGCRLSEILNVKWMDFGPEYSTVVIWKTKTDEPRTLPLAPRSRAILARRFANRAHGERGGPFASLSKDGSLRTQWERLRNLLEWDDVVIHTMRHTRASRFVQAGKDLMRVQKWMGHKRIETTLRYAHLMPSDLETMMDVFDGGGGPVTPAVTKDTGLVPANDAGVAKLVDAAALEAVVR